MREVEAMLSKTTQEYYGGLYVDFQNKVSNPENKFYPDYEIISAVISDVNYTHNVIDIGSGSCRWFKLFEPNVSKYFAIEVNETALANAPENSKIIRVNKNIFDEEFDLMKFVETDIDLAFFGFFLSHLSDQIIQSLLKKLDTVDHLIIVDSFWGQLHQQKYVSKDLREIKRRFSETERIVVPKRFFDKSDFHNLLEPFGYSIKKFVSGKYWFICVAEKQ